MQDRRNACQGSTAADPAERDGPHVTTLESEGLPRLLGLGEPGAFPSNRRCAPDTITEGATTATVQCDPDGAGKYMADFVSQLVGTQWAGGQTQYYQTVTDASGDAVNQFITNPVNQLGGIWVDDRNPITDLPTTSSSNPPGGTNTYTDLAAEAAQAAAHFGVPEGLANATS